jgi:hypothetical protein
MNFPGIADNQPDGSRVPEHSAFGVCRATIWDDPAVVDRAGHPGVCRGAVFFHGVLPHHKHELLPMRLMMGYSWGTLLASYVLLVGYVSRDVKRRNMPAALWMLIVVMMPGGIGAVVYFLLRQPILSRCPHCSTEIASSYTSARSASSRWRRCAASASAACRSRMCTARSADTTCRGSGAPARLRAFPATSASGSRFRCCRVVRTSIADKALATEWLVQRGLCCLSRQWPTELSRCRPDRSSSTTNRWRGRSCSICWSRRAASRCWRRGPTALRRWS